MRLGLCQTITITQKQKIELKLYQKLEAKMRKLRLTPRQRGDVRREYSRIMVNWRRAEFIDRLGRRSNACSIRQICCTLPPRDGRRRTTHVDLSVFDMDFGLQALLDIQELREEGLL